MSLDELQMKNIQCLGFVSMDSIAIPWKICVFECLCSCVVFVVLDDFYHREREFLGPDFLGCCLQQISATSGLVDPIFCFACR